MTPLAYSPDEAAKLCGIGRTRLYEAIRAGQPLRHGAAPPVCWPGFVACAEARRRGRRSRPRACGA